MLAKSLAKGKGGAGKGGPPLERQASAPQSMPTVRESASLRTDDESVSSDGGPAPLQPLDRRRDDDVDGVTTTVSSNDSAYDPAQRPLDKPNGMAAIATSSSGSSELPSQHANQQSSQSGSCSPPKPPDETDGFAGVPVSKPQPIPGSGSPPAEAPPLPPPSPFKNEAPNMGNHGPSVPSSAETPKVLSSSVDSDGVHNSADSLHGVSAAVRRAKQELMFFASVGDLKRCTILARTAKQLYGADITDCQDWDARRPLHAAAVHGCYQVCKWLLKVERVPASPVDKFGRTPLADAVRGDHMEVIALLQKYGGKVKDLEGRLVDYQIFNVKSLEEAVMREWEIDPADIRLGEKIGEGEFGIVFKAEWHSSTVAVKMLKRSDSIAMNDFRTELDVLQKMHHPNLVQFLGACTRSKPYMLVLEYLPGGSLADLLRTPELHPSLRRAIVMALDAAKAMTYLHAHMRQMVLHRDLKPANLLIGGIHAAPDNTSYVGARYGMVKVADFGLSRVTTLLKADLTPATSIASRMDSRNDSRTSHNRQDSVNDTVNSMTLRARSCDELDKEVYNYTGETGTYRYMAPEVYRHEPYNGKADVYSFAMICYELFEGRKPFSEMNATAAARAASLFDRRPPWGKVNRFQKAVPTGLKELVTECWSPAMDDRPDFGTITRRLEHIAKALPEDLDENSLIGSGGCCGSCSVQ